MSISSPCIKVCFVDPDAKLCVGCFRTLPELAQWTNLSDTERAAITEALPERRENYRSEKTVKP
jgi:uncharacterized protein